MYAGTLPAGEVYRYDGGTRWTFSACVDATPGVKYRRAWSMAVHDGQLHVGTLPSGKVWSFRSGHVATVDDGGGAASVVSLWAAVLAEIYLCNVCSCQEILRRNGRG
eukprot:SAG25_NODE_3_length_30426_cov_8.268210_21_plen_107_part_00